jgi:hypothetical protein|nr:MAG TPA: hypothetical protein [Caudoviricetes sp.]
MSDKFSFLEELYRDVQPTRELKLPTEDKPRATFVFAVPDPKAHRELQRDIVSTKSKEVLDDPYSVLNLRAVVLTLKDVVIDNQPKGVTLENNDEAREFLESLPAGWDIPVVNEAAYVIFNPTDVQADVDFTSTP